LNSRIITATLIVVLIVGVLPTFSLPARAAAPSFLVQKTWGGSKNDTGWALAQDSSGDMFVAGTTSSFGPRSPASSAILVLKYAVDGTLLWQRIWSNSSEEGRGIAVDSAGSVYVTGLAYFTNSSNSHHAGLLFKLDSAGNLQWQKVWSKGTFTDSNAVAVDSSNNVYVVGITDSFAFCCNDFTVMKFDSNGNMLWQHTWGGGGSETATGLAIDSSGNIYVTGYTDAFEASGGRGFQLVLLKLSSSGSLLFERIYGGTLDEFGSGVALDGAGNVYVTGFGRSVGIAGSFDLLVLKFDSTGALLAQRSWGGNSTDAGLGIAVDSSGHTLVTGYTSSYGAKGACSGPRLLGVPTCVDALLLRINPSLGVDYALVYGAAGKDDQSSGAAFDSVGNAIVAGYVGEAPPYIVNSGNTTLGTINLAVGPYGNNTLGNPGFTLRNAPNGMIQTASGSESYAGAQDVLMLKYGTSLPSSPSSTPFPIIYIEVLIAALVLLVAVLLLKRRRKTLKNAGPVQP
jgi:hypothetical protein